MAEEFELDPSITAAGRNDHGDGDHGCGDLDAPGGPLKGPLEGVLKYGNLPGFVERC